MRGLPAGPGGPLRKSNGRSPASLGADIEEIDALLAASKRARTSVAERASKLMSEHAAVQRGFERELDRETLRQKPKEKLKRRSGADHALLFHLARARTNPRTRPPPRRAAAPQAGSPPPDDAVIPPPPSYASETEAREWDEYYRFCARGALFKALDRGAAGRRAAALAETMAELEAAPGWAALVGDVDDEADGEDADLAAVRRASGAEIAARLDAYDPVGPRAPGHEHRLRDLGLKYRRRPRRREAEAVRASAARIARAASAPAPAAAVDDGPSEEERAAALEADAREAAAAAAAAMKALVHEAALEALESLSAQTESQSLASGESASASSHSGKHHHHHRHHHKKAPGSPGSHHGSHHGHHHLPGASVAAEMAEIIKQDEHVASMMHELPSNPDGLIDAQTGKAQLMSEIVAEHTVRVDLSFPSLESFRRAEHDVASYFMPDYSAHLSEPHGGGGGFWSGVRAETRRARLAPDDESHSTGSHRRPRHGGAGHQRSHDADESADGLRVRPLLLRVRRGDAHFLSVAPEGSEVRPPPVSFAHLAAFCATAARLEHDSGMELVARSEKAALAADDALACLDEPGEHTVKGLLEQEGLLGPAQDKFRDFVTSPAFRAAVQAQTNKQLAKHGGLGAAAAWRVVLAARDALANQAAVRVDVAAATDPEDGADATARCFDIIEENKQHHHTQTVHHGRRRISIVDTASRFTEFATFALLRAALRERRDDARRDAAAELAYVDLARCPPSSEQGCLDVVHRLVDLGALPASAARLLGSAELARGLDAALARRDAQRARSSHHASAGPRGHQAWDATGRELKLVFDEALEDEDHEPAAPLRAAEEPSAFDAYGSVVTRARSEGAELQNAMAAPEAPPEVLLARALRRAVVEAGAVYGAADVDADAADAADLDFSAAWVAAALAARAPRGGGDPADDAAARKVAALLAAATNGVVDATSLSLFVDDTSTDAGGSTAANFSSFHAQAERPVHRALRRVPIRHVTPPPDPRLHLAPASKFALLTVAVVDGPRDGSEPHAPAAPQSYALSALVFPGRAASSTTLDAADLPATVDQDRLPAELVRRATFDDSDLLEPLKLPRAAAANGN
ncbi:hypothetical protein JL722_3284 [Aureococcus anophagefferens]|nr:hypothetical protein JL722_3284 [Aureococcus anophagefferens]